MKMQYNSDGLELCVDVVDEETHLWERLAAQGYDIHHKDVPSALLSSLICEHAVCWADGNAFQWRITVGDVGFYYDVDSVLRQAQEHIVKVTGA